MSKSISIKNAMKKYGDFTVIPNSLGNKDGEFFTLQNHPVVARQPCWHDCGLSALSVGRFILMTR